MSEPNPAAADAGLLLANREDLEQQDITVYCSGYVGRALLTLAVEGLVLRLLTLAAIYCCPRGLTLEPAVVAAGTAAKRCRAWCRRRGQRNAAAAGESSTGAPASSTV